MDMLGGSMLLELVDQLLGQRSKFDFKLASRKVVYDPGSKSVAAPSSIMGAQLTVGHLRAGQNH